MSARSAARGMMQARALVDHRLSPRANAADVAAGTIAVGVTARARGGREVAGVGCVMATGHMGIKCPFSLEPKPMLVQWELLVGDTLTPGFADKISVGSGQSSVLGRKSLLGQFCRA